MNQVDFLIDRVLSLTRIEIEDGSLSWVAKSIENPSLEFTGEVSEKRDAQGTLIAQFDTAKGATLSGELSLLSMALMASQLGTEVQFGSAAKKLLVDYVDEVAIGADKKGALKYTPKTAPTAVYAMNADGSLGDKFEVGAEEGNAAISEKEVTMPATFEGTKVVCAYQYESETGVMVTDGAEDYTTAAKYVMKILAADVCNPARKRSGAIVFPKAKLDNNFSVNLTTDGTHPFSLTALKDYCDDDAKLCYVVWDE